MARRKTNSKGRNRHNRFILLDFGLLNSPAYRSLSPGARAMLVEFNRLYNGANNGELFVSQRDAAAFVGVSSHPTAAGYIQELQDKGFVRIRTKGSFGVKTRLATTYILTQHSYKDLPPTRDFRNWSPPPGAKQRGRKLTATGSKNSPPVPNDWPDRDEISTG